MKLQNKKTGEIVELTKDKVFNYDIHLSRFNSLAELNENWKDYEEPKDNDYWYIDDLGRIQFSSECLDEIANNPNNVMTRKIFGNHFETREEAEKAVEKLKAWKRLTYKGFKFVGVRPMGKVIDFDMPKSYHSVVFNENDTNAIDFYKDLMLVFGGEDD